MSWGKWYLEKRKGRDEEMELGWRGGGYVSRTQKKYKDNREGVRSSHILRTLSICVVPLDCVLMMRDWTSHIRFAHRRLCPCWTNQYYWSKEAVHFFQDASLAYIHGFNFFLSSFHTPLFIQYSTMSRTQMDYVLLNLITFYLLFSP